MNLNEIKSMDWQPKLNNIGEIVQDIDDINQCISIILMTPKGSVPHNPEFGSNVWLWIDAPIDEARPDIIRESIDAIQEWEPRIDISKISVKLVESNIIIRFDWYFKGSEQINTKEIKYERE